MTDVLTVIVNIFVAMSHLNKQTVFTPTVQKQFYVLGTP